MKITLLQVLVAALLMAGGIVLWTRGSDAGHLAEAQRAFLTLQYGQAAEAAATSAAARYWNGDYAAVPADADPLLAANAAYRVAVVPGGTARQMATRLDDVVKRYAEVLRNDPGNEDAAFNYEFVIRHRAAIAAGGLPIPPTHEDSALTPHGRAGAPPKSTDQKQFKILVPMRPEERREGEESGRTERRVRKG